MTLKQRLFVKKYLEENGNGTRAALAVYDTVVPCVAAVIASQNINKPKIKRAIDLAFEYQFKTK